MVHVIPGSVFDIMGSVKTFIFDSWWGRKGVGLEIDSMFLHHSHMPFFIGTWLFSNLRMAYVSPFLVFVLGVFTVSDFGFWEFFFGDLVYEFPVEKALVGKPLPNISKGILW